MIPSLVLGVILTIALLVLIGFAVSALIQLKKTLVNVDTLVVNMDGQLKPLLNELNDTVKRVNSEIGRLDDIIGTVKDIGDKVSATTRVVNEIISSPLIRVASISSGAKEAIKKFVGK